MGVATLPDTFLVDTFSLLPMPDLMKFRRVCKQWNGCAHQVAACLKTLNISDLDLSSFLQIPIKMDDGSTCEHDVYNPEAVSRSLSSVLTICGTSIQQVTLEKVMLDGRLSSVLAELCPNLESITLTKVGITAEFMPNVKLTTLTVSDLYAYSREVLTVSLDDAIISRFVQWINGMEGLVTLEIGPCDMRVAKKLDLTKFRSINISNLSTQFNNNKLPPISSEAREIHLNGIDNVDLSSLHACSNLDSLTLGDGTFSRNQFERLIAAVPALTKLSIKNCRHLTSLTCLDALTNLEELQLYGCVFSTASAHAVSASCANMKVLRLSGIKMDDSALSELVLPRLRRLSLYNCKSISDKGLEQAIGHSPGLESLSVEWCQGISDALLAKLPVFSSLKRLDISFTGCTPEGVLKFDQIRGTLACAMKLWVWPIMNFRLPFVSKLRITDFMKELFPAI